MTRLSYSPAFSRRGAQLLFCASLICQLLTSCVTSQKRRQIRVGRRFLNSQKHQGTLSTTSSPPNQQHQNSESDKNKNQAPFEITSTSSSELDNHSKKTERVSFYKDIDHGERRNRKLALASNEVLWNDPNYYYQFYFIIAVFINESYTKSQKELLRDSIMDLQKRSKVIRIRFQDTKPTNGRPYLHIYDGGKCSSTIGRSSSADSAEGQLIYVGQRCLSKGTIQHEFLHALGFLHEQSRPDRDKYVIINEENIEENRKDSFAISDYGKTLGTPYDLNSVMHYGAKSSSKNGKDTITVKKSGDKIGNGNEASDTDIAELRLMYQCKSGPRTLSEMKNKKCTSDCKCWNGRKGCGTDDNNCKGELACINDKCAISKNGNKPKKAQIRSLVKYHNGQAWYVNGYVFDVKAKTKPLEVTNFWLVLKERDDPYTIEIWTKEGTHMEANKGKGKYDSKDWDLLTSLKVYGKDTWKAQLLPKNQFKPQEIGKKSIRAFYITIKDSNTNAFLAPEGDGFNLQKWMWNPNMVIREGCVLNYPFNNYFEDCSTTSGGKSYNFLGGIDYLL